MEDIVVIVNPVIEDVTVIVEPNVATAESVGLGNVDNTSDAAKPISSAVQVALNAKLTATTAAFNAKLTATPAQFNAKIALTDLPATFPPIIGTTATTAMAGNRAIPTIPATMTQAEAEAGTSTTQRTVTAQRINQAIQALSPAQVNPTWVAVTGKPTTFAPIVGTTGTTAMAGNTSIPQVPAIMPQDEAETGTSTTQRTITALALSQAISAQGVPASAIPVTGIINGVGGAYFAGRTSGTAGGASRAIPAATGSTGSTGVLRGASGSIEASTFIVTQATQSGTVLNLGSDCTKYETLSAGKTYTFSGAIDGAGMQIKVINGHTSGIAITFTGGILAKGQDGIIGVGEYAIFTICVIFGIISVTKVIFDVA